MSLFSTFPVLLKNAAKLILYLIPISAFTTPRAIELGNNALLSPLGDAGGFHPRHTLDGKVFYHGREDILETMFGYVLLFRNGLIEAVDSVGYVVEGGNSIDVDEVERNLLRYVPQYLQALSKWEVEPPYYLFLSLIGVRDHWLGSRYLSPHSIRRRVRQDVLLLPEIVVQDLPALSQELLRPQFDLIWNAFGFQRSC